MAPGGAYTVIKPSLALSAPQTTLTTLDPPILTSQSLSLSAFGCFSVFNIFTILNSDILPELSLIPSTSSPMFVNFSIISFTLAFVLK